MSCRSVALCITDLDAGGAERALVELATRLDRERFEPVVYCLGPRPERDEASCVPPLEEAGITVHCLGGRGSRDLPRVLSQLTQLLRQQSPDLLQSFLFHANLAGRVAARRVGVRRVVSGVRVAERSARWHLWLDWFTHHLVDHYVCVSQAVARFSATAGGVPTNKLSVIPNGIDLRRYPAAPRNLADLGIAPPRRAVTFVGRLERQKGVGWLIDAAPAWLGQVDDCDLLLVGEGPERPRLEAACRSLGIADRVHFAGWRGDVPEILAASELLVLPSAWEGMPNAVLQAMASAKPVLATDVEGVKELLGAEAESQVVHFGDSAALASRLVAIVSDPRLSGRLGHANRARSEQEFSIDRVVTAYQDFWQSLLADG